MGIGRERQTVWASNISLHVASSRKLVGRLHEPQFNGPRRIVRGEAPV
jgi:hypothetical protein